MKQYIRSLTVIAKYDYPNAWPSLLFDLTNNYLNQQNEKAVLTGLQALKGLCKKYEYELDETRQPLFDIVG